MTGFNTDAATVTLTTSGTRSGALSHDETPPGAAGTDVCEEDGSRRLIVQLVHTPT
jgi:hypothetical protein